MARIKSLFKYGWQHAGDISSRDKMNKIRVFCDIIWCYYRYHLYSNQYKKERFHLIDSQERDAIGEKYKKKNDERDRWQKEFLDTQRFLLKWSSRKYSLNGDLREKRDHAYKRHYKYNHSCKISSGVTITKHHYYAGKIDIGEDCKILENTDIDYTGGLVLEKHVTLSEGVKLLTHAHDSYFLGQGDEGSSRTCKLSPLIIHDHAWLGAKSFVHPGVKEIGRRAIIGANSNVKSKVPPYAILMGNPAKIIGFVATPQEILKFEKEHYPESERIPLEVLEKNHNKYFKSRIKEIKEFVKL